MPRKDEGWVGDAEMSNDDLAKQVAEIGGDLEVSTLEPIVGLESRPCPIHAAAADAAAEQEDGIPVTVVGATVAVLRDRATEFRHGEDDNVVETLAEVERQCVDPPREIVEPTGELAGCATFVHVMVPVPRFCEGDLKPNVRLDQLCDLAQRLTESAARIACAGGRSVGLWRDGSKRADGVHPVIARATSTTSSCRYPPSTPSVCSSSSSRA